MKTPLLFMIFNRPDTTRRVFAEIRKAKPERLFISADGPRPDRPEDIENCREAREIVSRVDWPCEVKKLYHDKNLGCQIAPSSAVTWFFENAEAGMILEDDCVPDPSFFPFCEELLERYKDDPRIIQICANNSQQNNARFKCVESYFFSIVPHLWGWASWRRSWKHYDLEMKGWPEDRDRGTLHEMLPDPAVYEYWEDKFDAYYNGVRNSWDWPWVYACMSRQGLSIIPRVNLVTNIGYGAEATHTKNIRSPSSNMPASRMGFPLVHPQEIEPNVQADAFMFRNDFGIDATLRQRIVGPIRRTFPDSFRRIKRLIGNI